MTMKEDYEKISKLRYRDRITNSDINFIQQMYNKYCSQLKKNICWQCPNSIREAIFDLLRHIENNPLQDESKNDTIDKPGGSGERDKPIPGRSKSGKLTDGNKK